MKRKSNKELGVLLPQCMVDTIANAELTDAQVGKIVRAVVLGNAEVVKEDLLARTLATSFRNEYRIVNNTRMESIKLRRERNKESERRRRNLAKISEKMLENAVDSDTKKHMCAHVRPCTGKNVIKEYNIITPHISPQGGRGGAPAAARSVPKPEVEGRAKDAGDAFAEIWARHPRKEGETRARRTFAAQLKKNPAALEAIQTGHAAWCATERWTKEGGRYAPKLAAWLAEQGWEDEPPERKPTKAEPPPAKCGMGL